MILMFFQATRLVTGVDFNYVLVDFLFDLIVYVHSTIFQLCGTILPRFNQY